ncbi:hypothetical protein UY3_16590 [Chelonia mydas]|uniref:Uncharacterized protein n=1 Tax=Chelonia mydas TaxID=8469 RepID=M7AP68_CHEMY|nr:hypothetical protein UY3_16590 [Chelonia mydas]
MVIPSPDSPPKYMQLGPKAENKLHLLLSNVLEDVLTDDTVHLQRAVLHKAHRRNLTQDHSDLYLPQNIWKNCPEEVHWTLLDYVNVLQEDPPGAVGVEHVASGLGGESSAPTLLTIVVACLAAQCAGEEVLEGQEAEVEEERGNVTEEREQEEDHPGRVSRPGPGQAAAALSALLKVEADCGYGSNWTFGVHSAVLTRHCTGPLSTRLSDQKPDTWQPYFLCAVPDLMLN